MKQCRDKPSLTSRGQPSEVPAKPIRFAIKIFRCLKALSINSAKRPFDTLNVRPLKEPAVTVAVVIATRINSDVEPPAENSHTSSRNISQRLFTCLFTSTQHSTG
ncbi:hypothetical protein J6590_050670 [Homalodisca vitripennis]|nr:hypothetical protein J6590_050670 [Homalodisca vitripennis]